MAVRAQKSKRRRKTWKRKLHGSEHYHEPRLRKIYG